MSRSRVAVVGFTIVCLLGSLSVSAGAQQDPNECQAGENSTPGPPTEESADDPRCDATPSDKDSADEAPAIPELQGVSGGIGPAAVTPVNRFWLGIGENGSFTSETITSTFNVVDPQVPWEGGNFLSQRARALACSTGQWLEIGWGEAAWHGSQSIYTYNTVTGEWRWFDQYGIGPGSRFTVQVVHIGNGDWSAELWWDGQWNRLTIVNLGNDRACDNESMVEISTEGTNRQFPFPSIQFGDGSTGYYSMGLWDSSAGVARYWNTSIPTQENVTSEANYYTTTFTLKYGNFRVNSNNRAPSATVNVSPLSGNRTTNFSASISASDPDGDTIDSYRIDWGDGESTWSQSASHQYRTSGTFNVRAEVCDMWFKCTLSSAKTVTVAFSNTAPNVTFVVNPPEGTLTTEFVADFGGTSDPERDAINYQVNWGDGTTTSGRRTTHTYSALGTYNIRAVATDEHGASTVTGEVIDVCAVSTEDSCIDPTENEPCTSDTACSAADRPLVSQSSSANPTGSVIALVEGCRNPDPVHVEGEDEARSTQFGVRANIFVNQFSYDQCHTVRSIGIIRSSSYLVEVGWRLDDQDCGQQIHVFRLAFNNTIQPDQDNFGCNRPLASGVTARFRIVDGNRNKNWAYSYVANKLNNNWISLGSKFVDMAGGVPVTNSETHFEEHDSAWAHFTQLADCGGASPGCEWKVWGDLGPRVTNENDYYCFDKVGTKNSKHYVRQVCD